MCPFDRSCNSEYGSAAIPLLRHVRFAYDRVLKSKSKEEIPMSAIRRISSAFVWLALGLMPFLAASPASAQDAERAFYAGKTVRMVVGSATGGGYDIYSRLIAPYLAKKLGATVIVENQPGAGGLISLNRLYVTEPDGLVLSLANGTAAAFAQLTDQQGARFDLAKFDFLATVGAPPGLWLVGPNSPIKTVNDAIKAKMKWRWAASGPADGLGNGAAFTCEALKLDCQIVPGYGGSAQSGLAVTKGEMDAVYVPESSANNFVKAKQNQALATMARKKSRWFLDKPTIFEATELNADQQWLFDFFSGVEGMGRILILPPGVPKARLAFLQEVVKQTLHDPQLIADGERTERIIEYLDPASTLKNAQTIVSNVTPEQKKRVQTILARNK
jgi:tripartite-type tricarboxylate transporter receptor subunit TctC